MFRSRFAVFGASLLLTSVSPAALAADYPDEMRGSYDWGDQTDFEDSIGFEAGLRYLYSMGGQNFSVGGTNESSTDTSHILEGFIRIDDRSTKSFLRGTAGYAFAVTGNYSGDWGAGAISDGTIGYVGGDFGGYWFGDPKSGVGVGGFIGYQHLSDNPDIGRANFTTASSVNDVSWSTTSTYWTVPMDSKPNSVNVDMLRLGVTARAELNTIADISLDLAAIPYANISGIIGAFGVPSVDYGSYTTIQSSAAEVAGWGYGGAADLMIGFHPTENMVVRLGGQARYIQGTYDSTFTGVTVYDQDDVEPVPPDGPDGIYETPPIVTSQRYISTDNPFSMWRLSGMLELGVSF